MIHAGDTVHIVVDFFTSDPNEGQEAEPLVVKDVAGAFAQTITSYGSQMLQFTAPVDGDSVYGYIPGSDGDDGFALLTFASRPMCSQALPQRSASTEACPVPPPLSNPVKDQGAVMEELATLEAAAGIACLFNPPLCAAGLVGEAITGTLGGALLAGAVGAIMHLDPPDPNFMVVAPPGSPTLPPPLSGDAVTDAVRAASNAVYMTQANIGALGFCIGTAANRAAGANNAGDATWAVRQGKAAQEAQLLLGVLLGSEPQLLNRLALAIKAAAPLDVPLEPETLLETQRFVAANGLPERVTTALASAGADGATIRRVTQAVILADRSQVASTLLGNIANPNVTTPMLAAARVLAPLRPFVCYRAVQRRGSEDHATAFKPVLLTLQDTFGGPTQFQAQRISSICNPADVDSADPAALADSTHLEGVALHRKAGAGGFSRRGETHSIFDVLHPQGVMVRLAGEDDLFVPSGATLGTTSAAGMPPPGVDHLRCYRTRLKPTRPAPTPTDTFQPVAVQDFLGSLTWAPGQPTKLCTPADANGSTPGALDDVPTLVCYASPRAHSARREVSTANELGHDVLRAGIPFEVCVPAVVDPGWLVK